MEESQFKKTTLDNGVRIVTESIPHVRSVAAGFWFDSGSRDEPEHLSGIAHFLEHMNFKGTSDRTAGKIAREIEGRGGQMNAFTSKEVTCYHARVIDEQFSRCIDVLSDITQNSVYDETEIARERDVVLEELKNLEDTPDEIVFEYFVNQVFKDHSMGRSVLGYRESLPYLNHDELTRYSAERNCGKFCVIAASGKVDHRRLVKMVERRMTESSSFEQVRPSPLVLSESDMRQEKTANTQQTHIVIGCRGLEYADERRYPLSILSTLLGGGMSSRLFQNIREKAGLAYSVFSFFDTYHDTGLFGIYTGTMPEKSEQAIGLVRRELKKLISKPVSNRELTRTKDQLKGSIMLGLESPSARMHRLARMELNTGEFLPIDDVIDRINNVSSKDIQELSEFLFQEQTQYVTILSPENSGEFVVQ